VSVRFLDQPELNTEGKYADFLLTVLRPCARGCNAVAAFHIHDVAHGPGNNGIIRLAIKWVSGASHSPLYFQRPLR